MPEGEGGEARGRLSQLLSGDLALVAEGPDVAAGSNRGRLMPSRSDAGRAARACAKCDNRRQTTDA